MTVLPSRNTACVEWRHARSNNRLERAGSTPAAQPERSADNAETRAMIRRGVGLLVLVAVALFAGSLTATAQQPDMHRIGFLWAAQREALMGLVAAAEAGLRELGYVEGQNVVFEHRFAEGKPERLPGLAVELVRMKVDVIVAGRNPLVMAAKQATGTIPIVATLASDPVGVGFASSLSRPGGNVTGLIIDVTPEMWGKSLQILKDLVPKASRLAVLWNSAFPANMPFWQASEDAARRLRVKLISAEVRGPDEFDKAFATIIRERAQGVLVIGDPATYGRRQEIAALAAQHRLPSMWSYREALDAGGLASYGPSLYGRYRQAALYVDKILKGARPGDLPMEQPTRFELAINLKTARNLGLTIPSSVLLLADQVIE